MKLNTALDDLEAKSRLVKRVAIGLFVIGPIIWILFMASTLFPSAH